MRIYRLSEGYRGNHTAPTPGIGESLDDLSAIYPDDIYDGMGAVRNYGHGERYDNESIIIIQSARGRPNYPVTIYRAVPDKNHGIKQELKKLHGILFYFDRFGFFPMNNEVVRGKEDLYSLDEMAYDERVAKVYGDIEVDIEGLKGSMVEDFGIGVGDWVTISRAYAKEHGEASLNGEYRIVSKRVRAKELYTTGDSIHEWGYYP